MAAVADVSLPAKDASWALVSCVAVLPNRSIPSATTIPVLIYSDVRAAVSWLSEAFGFAERLQIGEDHLRTRPYRPQTNGKAERSSAPCWAAGLTELSTAIAASGRGP